MLVLVELHVIGMVSGKVHVVKSNPVPGTPSFAAREVAHPGMGVVVPPGNGTVFVMARFLTP
jgi:hypothetical protein